MPDNSAAPTMEERQARLQASGERDVARPDLRQVPENPPVDQHDLDRGREKLDRVISK